jgi:prepilin-type processing-associated H-X9-DG protein/prepilin-type N-terminal cleavage/methylation domain-containing protein
MRHLPARRAFTLIELLVVIAIIVLMMALLLPAIQKVREAANTMSCGNNLKQMGIGCHMFCNDYGRYPAAKVASGSAGKGQTVYAGPEWNYSRNRLKIYNQTGFIALLPYIEQQSLYARYNPHHPSSNSSWYGGLTGADLGGNANVNAPIVGEFISLYTCPSDHVPGAVVTDNGNKGNPNAKPPVPPTPFWYAYSRQNARRSNYLWATYFATDYTPSYPYYSVVGITGTNGSARIADIKDGTSNTIAIGESRQDKVSSAYGPYWGSGTHTCCHGVVLDYRFHINYPFGQQQYGWSGRLGQLQYAWGFGSWHPGGANFLFADGSVRFLANDMSFRLFQALNSINGFEEVSEDN